MAAETVLYAPAPVPAPRLGVALRPALAALRGLAGFGAPDIVSAAAEQWTVAEGGSVEVRPARFLAGQLDRITGTEFGTRDEIVRDFRGGFVSRQGPTRGYRLNKVLLFDGVLYADGAVRHLRARQHRARFGSPDETIARAALYESWLGNRWFANWLSDDCLTYRLAEQEGFPVTTARCSGHMAEYERRLGITPRRIGATWFDELILFDDRAHNDHLRSRASDLRRRLVGAERPRHSGAFLLRGTTGALRMLKNERAIAEHLAARRGFRVIDASTATVAEIVEACAGAQVVMGVEGSHLGHGMVLMPPGACLFTIQPPDRAVSVLKLVTDRQGQDYSFVVGRGKHEAFCADIGEIERTLDLA